MLRSANSLIGHKLLATDGELGKVKDLYFDDREWQVRYLLVNTGGWLTGRRVLISPVVAGTPNWPDELLPVNLSMKQVENSPLASEDKPVSRQFEEELNTYYGWPLYWVPAPSGVPAQAGAPAVARAKKRAREKEDHDPHLRSLAEVTGYHIEALDDEMGHVDDVILDTLSWRIRYLVVDTRDWLPGQKVLVARRWIRSISWEGRKVSVDLSRETIKESPEFNPEEPVNRRYEERLYDYYGRPAYWA